MIDVVERRLVEAPGSTLYFALPYDWGKGFGTAVLETTMASVATHEEKESLDPDRADIPETIRDVMRLVIRLGEICC